MRVPVYGIDREAGPKEESCIVEGAGADVQRMTVSDLQYVERMKEKQIWISSCAKGGVSLSRLHRMARVSLDSGRDRSATLPKDPVLDQRGYQCDFLVIGEFPWQLAYIEGARMSDET